MLAHSSPRCLAKGDLEGVGDSRYAATANRNTSPQSRADRSAAVHVNDPELVRMAFKCGLL